MPTAGSSTLAPVPDRPRGRPQRDLPPCVREALRSLGVRYAREGVRVFLFGSVARTWPQAPVGADFDVGYEIGAAGVDPVRLRHRLEEDLAALPSIRPVDLVDFASVSETFRTTASVVTLDLAHVAPPSTTR